MTAARSGHVDAYINILIRRQKVIILARSSHVIESNTQQFDVVICGAGPAGTTCALALADSGLRVAVIEKSTFPRDKTCGDAVAAYAIKVLNSINPSLADSLKNFEEKVSVQTCRLVSPQQKIFDLTYQESGFIARRIDWDNFLFEKAFAQNNISFFLNHTVSDVTIGAAAVKVVANDIHFNAQMVIGCDGAHSMVNKKMTGTKPDPHHYSAAVRAYYSNVSGIPENTFEIHLIKDLLPGYFWIFPLKNNLANVGLGVLSSEVSKRKLNLRNLMEKIVEEVPYIRDRFTAAERIGKIEGFGLPLGSRKVPLSGERFILCGDAGSLIDPLSGEGIGQAMVSGRNAGQQIKKCFSSNNFSAAFMKQYDESIYQKFWSRHRKNLFIRQLMHREWMVNGVFNVALNSKFLGKWIAKSVA